MKGVNENKSYLSYYKHRNSCLVDLKTPENVYNAYNIFGDCFQGLQDL